MAVGLFVSLWLSFLARTFSWIIMLQRNGVINRFLQSSGITDAPLSLVYNKTSVYIGMVHALLPFMIVTLVPALRAINPVFSRAAVSLGATPFKAFVYVYFPLSLPGVVAGSMLVFTLAFGFFVTPAILGGGRAPTIILAVRDLVQQVGDMQLASALSMTLLVICAALLVFYERMSGIDRMFGAEKR
jgi:ABC-type spermidine/putrescine transport system permease subunit I